MEEHRRVCIGGTAAVIGKMNVITTKSGNETGELPFVLRAKVRGVQVVWWHWYEDSFAINQANHGLLD